MLPKEWNKLSKRKKKFAVVCLRLYWFSFNPIIRPLLIGLILLFILPKHPIATPTAIGLAFGLDAIIRTFELLGVKHG